MSDLDGICVVKRRGHLIAADQHADEFFAGIKEGAECLVTIRRPRSIRQHRLLFAVLQKVVENTDQWASVELLLDDVKVATGHGELRINAFTGERQIKAKSINFAAMKQDVFNPWFERVIDLLATEVLGIMPEALHKEVLAMVEPRAEAA